MNRQAVSCILRNLCAVLAAVALLAPQGAEAAWHPGLYGGFQTAGATAYTVAPIYTNNYFDTAAATNYCSSTTTSTAPVPGGATLWSNNRCWSYRGKVYPAAGSVTLSSFIDDNARLYIDGVQVIDTTGCKQGSVTLTFDEADWHDFLYLLGNGSVGAGPVSSSGLGGGKGFGIKENGATTWSYPADDGTMSRYRYDDGLGFDDSITISGSPVNAGLVSPAYGSSQGHAPGAVIPCSATSGVASASGYAGICTGFVAYATAYDENYVLMRGAVYTNGTSTAFDYVHPGYQTELVWLWQEPLLVELDLSASTGGTASATPAADAYGLYASNTVVTLTATPADGYTFAYWADDLPEGVTATNPAITFVIDRPRRITAVFGDPVPPIFMKADATGDGSGKTWKNACTTLAAAVAAGSRTTITAAA